jgi:GntR family transcriptional repressor for pyruvate dehydrogenase complex
MSNLEKSGATFQFERVGQSGSLASHVAKQLESQITTGAISIGEKLPTENKLCELFGVSRTVIREAITQLKSLGLVETRRGVGTTVMRSQPAETMYAYTINPTAVEDILNILEMRLSVETSAAEFAAIRHDEADMQRMEQSLAAFNEALERGEQARKEDYEFHLAISQATKNPFFRQFYEQFNKNVIPRAKLVNTNLDQVATDAYLQRVKEEHEEILSAIRSRDAELARKAMHKHLYRAYHLYEKYQTHNRFE